MFNKLTKSILFIISIMMISSFAMTSVAYAREDEPPTPEPSINFSVEAITQGSASGLTRTVIGSPPTPPTGFEVQRLAASLPEPNQQAGTNSLSSVPAYDWSYGCSPTSASMIAGYYDANGYPNLYTGATNGGVMPSTNATWGAGENPLSASKNGIDGRSSRGHVDDYWLAYNNVSNDPFYGNWAEHARDSLGDHMKTSQWNNYSNADGSTAFYTWTSSPAQLTCQDMAGMLDNNNNSISNQDGTYGTKLFYASRGYNTSTCYAQRTDNNVAGGFSFADYKAEIDAGNPVMLHVQGHTMTGVGYDDIGSKVYFHDTWDYDTHEMTWGGSYSSMDQYAVSIVHLGDPLPPAKYDDTHDAWSFSGTWTGIPITGAYNDTFHYSTTTGNYAEITFDGEQVTLVYTPTSNRGIMGIYIDGALVHSLNQYASSLAFQQTWTSNALGSGPHTLRLVHASGGVVEFDAIEVSGPSAPDTTAPATITLAASTGSTNGTVSLSWTAPGDDNDQGTASSYDVRYSSSSIDDETDWGNATVVNTGVPTPQIAGSSEAMTVSGLTAGDTYYFAIKAQDEVPNQGNLSNSPSATASTSTGPVIYDDTHGDWVFSGTWTGIPITGAYNDTFHYSTTAGNYAEITFDGEQVMLVYTPASNRGFMGIYIDGALVHSLNQYASTLTFQQTWTSNALGSGPHTLRLVHASGGVVEFDAIEVLGPPPLLDFPEDTSTIESNIPQYQWQETSGATKYLLEVKKDNVAVFSNWYDVGSDVTCNSGICATLPNIPLTEGLYEWTVQPWTSSGLRGWYAPFTFTVEVPSVNWTFLVYLNGDNSLESAGIDDFLEMAAVGSDAENLKIAVQFDRADGYDESHDDWQDTRRFLVNSEMIPRAAAGESIGEANMGDPQTLVDFVEWGMSAFPASQYALIIWDHGNTLNTVAGPVEALAWDQTSSGDFLTMAELSSALATITNNGETPINLLGFDASLMGSIEVDNQLLSYAEVRVGSEELQPNDGWPYDIWLDDIDGTSTVGYVADKIVNDYFAFYSNDKVQSAVDLRVPYTTLNTAVNDFADLLIQEAGVYLTEIESARSNTQEFSNPNYIDLYDFAYQVEQTVANTAIDAAANAVMTAVNNAVIQEQHGASWTDANGISIYFPELEENYDESYAGSEGLLHFTANNHWDEWIEFFYGAEPPLGSGKYDDTHDNWVFSGNWVGIPITGAYNDTFHYSTTAGNFAELTFGGEQVTLVYTPTSNRGIMGIYIDGALVHSLNQYASSLAFQQTWTSNNLGSGLHTIKLVHASGGVVEFDAIEVLGPDTTSPAVITLSASTGSTNGSVSLSWLAPGDDNDQGTASAYLVRYSSTSIDDETDWTNATVVSTGVPSPQIAGSSEQMTVSGLTAGDNYFFAIRAQDEVPNSGSLSNSPNATASTATGPVIYDDTDPNWVFSGNWFEFPITGAYNDTFHYSTTAGNYAEFTFDGEQVTLVYTPTSNRGIMGIYIDGALVHSLNQYASSLTFQETWASSNLGSGVHTIKLVHASGGVVEFDAIEILP